MDTPGITPKVSPNGLTNDEGPSSDAGNTGKPRKKRGAPFGNQNSRKHGFYSKYLPPEQAKLLEEAGGLRDLRPEIALLRVKLNDLLEDPDTAPELILKTVNALTRLLSVQRRYVWQ